MNPSIMEEIEKKTLEKYDEMFSRNSVSSNLESPVVDPQTDEEE